MRVLYGKPVLDGLDERLAPSSTALVVVDVQNDFAHERGAFALDGLDVSPIAATVPVIADAVERARRAGVRVVWIQQTYLPDGLLDPPAWLEAKDRAGVRPDYTIDGTWGHAIVDELVPRPGELVVRKHRQSAFCQTPLDQALRHLGIGSVLLCGCLSDGCVEATAMEAGWLGYYVQILEGGVASTSPEGHAAVMTLFGRRYPQVGAEVLECAWPGAARPSAAAGDPVTV